MTDHAKLSASGSHRWLNCLGSVDAERDKKNTTSAAAEEGTRAHELAEMQLIAYQKDSALAVCPKSYPEDMQMYVQQYVDYVIQIGGEQFYEERVDFSEWVPEGFGTSDVIAIDGDTIHIIDLKYGRGVPVYAEKNSQAMLYALGAYAEYSYLYKFKKAVLHIVQPRIDNISVWEISIEDLLKWGAWVSEQTEIITAGNAPRTPGEKQCQWCTAKATCPALKRHTEELLMSHFNEMDPPKPDTLTDQELLTIMESKKLAISFFDAVEDLVKERLETGEGFKGFKLVAGRSVRKWDNEVSAAAVLERFLGEEAYETKILSPSKAEKKLGKKKAEEVQKMIVKTQGNPVLVPERDPRKSVNITVDDFD